MILNIRYESQIAHLIVRSNEGKSGASSPTSSESPFSHCADEALLESLAVASEDLAELAEWAFGVEGFPDLQVIAYGDFSNNGRFRKSTALLSRNTDSTASSSQSAHKNFVVLRPNDYDLQPQSMKTLTACPVSPIFDR